MKAHVVLLAALAAGSLRAAVEIPQWVRDAASTPVHSYPAKVSSVALLREEAVTVDPDGHRVMRERGAIRILQMGGDKVEAYRTYNTRSGRIRDFEGWLISPAGKITPYPRKSVIDVAITPNWDEERAKVLEAGTNEPGAVFAWEVTEEQKTVFTQYEYSFQGRRPVVASRFSLTLPAGWEVRDTLLNHAKLDAQVSGSTYTWDLRDLPWIQPEDYSPTLAALVPRMMISYFPPADNRAGLQGLKDWRTVSTWLAGFMDPAAEVSDAIQAKAAELTAHATSDLDKIRAIGAFVQATVYVSVDMNLDRGGGYAPHRAEETLSRNYGDCKDKATLMRALLKAAGIDSYPLAIYYGDQTYVRAEWASPFQFNHAIIAIRVPDSVTLPTVIASSPLGRLLIFDPTDPVTPVGELPEPEQGSYALLIAPQGGGLLTMPLLPANANRLESTVEGAVDARGRVEARIHREYHGQSGSALREMQRVDGQDEIRKAFERGLSRRLNGVAVKSIDAAVKPGNFVAVDIDLSADQFAQLMQGRMLLLRPGFLSSGGDYFFAARERSAPIRVESDLRRDSIRIKIPDGFKPDELPRAAKIDSPYGTLQASWKIEGGEIVMEETLELKETVAPAADYAKVREFFDQVAGAQSAPVVLVRQ